MANNNPAAVPSPTGKAISQANYNIIGTKGMRKKELQAETRLAKTSMFVYSRGQNKAIAVQDPI